MAQQAFKIVLVGEAGTGKSSIIRRYCNATFESTGTTSIGLDCKVKQIEEGGSRCVLTIWDTAGQERFAALCNSCYRGAHAVIFVYDIGNYESFKKLDQWWTSVDERVDSREVVRMVVGNKSDFRRVNGMELSEEDGRAWATKKGISWAECSASMNEGLDAVFKTLVQELIACPSFQVDANRVLVSKQARSKGCC